MKDERAAYALTAGASRDSLEWGSAERPVLVQLTVLLDSLKQSNFNGLIGHRNRKGLDLLRIVWSGRASREGNVELV